ncbi:hypothetical protein MBLNU13_g10421t2 [Cladosporium sp. NU13]
MAPAPFEYRALEPGNHQIRIFYLHPAKNLDDPLSGTLRHTNLDSSSFPALSYVCGPKNSKTEQNLEVRYKRTVSEFVLHSNSSSVTYSRRIQSNLATALRYLRDKRETLTIWADDLCIDEPNTEEKTQQIALMSTLYTRATRVHAWLGSPLDGGRDMIDKALDLAERLWEFAVRCSAGRRLEGEDEWLQACFTIAKTSPSNVGTTPNEVERAWRELWVYLRDAVGRIAKLEEFLLAMCALSQNPYFTRVWILQETGKAKANNLTFHYGRRTIQYKCVFLALSLALSLRTSKPISPSLEAELDNFDVRFLSLLTARKTIQSGLSISAVLKLTYFEHESFGAQDVKDQIHARLGLARDRSGITLNSAWSVRAVYVEATQCLLRRGFTDILLSFKPYDWSNHRDDLPSWVYDWSTKGSDSFVKYAASSSERPQIAFAGTLEHDSRLEMVGLRIGRVQVVEEQFQSCARDALFSEHVWRAGDLRMEARTPREIRLQLVEDIAYMYSCLQVQLSNEVRKALGADYNLPVAKFWSWWMQWVSSVWEADTGRTLDTVNEPVSRAVLELIFRAAPVRQSSLVARFKGVRTLSSLLDFGFWSRLIFHEEYRDKYIGDRTVTTHGIELMDIIFQSAWGMRAISIEGGYFGCAREDVEENDEVVVFLGTKAPLIVRRTASNAACYKIIGPAHVSGIMDGQAMAKPELPCRRYVLV